MIQRVLFYGMCLALMYLLYLHATEQQITVTLGDKHLMTCVFNTGELPDCDTERLIESMEG